MRCERSFPDGSVTRMLVTELKEMSLDINENPLDLIDYISDISEQAVFAEGMKNLCVKHGYKGDESDNKAITDFIVTKAKNKGILKNSKEQNAFRTNISNWLNEGEIDEKTGKIKSAPDDISKSRLNVYKLCFALELDLNETEEFFLKKYLFRPFNFRDRQETVFYYALKNGKDYTYCEQLLEEINSHKPLNRTESLMYTEAFRKGLEREESEEDFLDYCIKNDGYFGQSNVTAIEEIENLLKETFELLASGANNLEIQEDEVDKVSYVLREIYGGEQSYYDKREKRWHKSKKTSTEILKRMRVTAPKKIYSRMPSEQEISRIKKGESVSNELLRKTLILLCFYNYFTIWEADGGDNPGEDNYEDFVSEIDYVLFNCGFVQSYARNPYDWIFLYCSKQDDPVETFQEILNVYYTEGNPSE